MNEKSCHGYRTSGHWRGYPCGAIPKFKHEGFSFCGSHYAMSVEGTKNGHLANCPACFGFECECLAGQIDKRLIA